MCVTGSDTACIAWQRPIEHVLHSASIPFNGMAISTGLAERAESMERRQRGSCTGARSLPGASGANQGGAVIP